MARGRGVVVVVLGVGDGTHGFSRATSEAWEAGVGAALKTMPVL